MTGIEQHTEQKRRFVLKVIATPTNYGICEGCENVIATFHPICPFCHSYRLILDVHKVCDRARLRFVIPPTIVPR